MAWDERQTRMLAEMGIRLWPSPHSGEHRAAVPADVAPPSTRPAERVGGEAPASQDPTAGPVARASGSDVPAREAVAADRGARPVGVQTMDWTALRAAVADCTACALSRGRTNTVFGVGHEQAHWMVVGEAPGEQEDRLGEPFVGKAGQLLDNMLRALGLTRRVDNADARPEQQVFIANVLKCRPPMNRNPLPDEVAQCAPYLARQVALVQPRLILAMGRFAVQSLLRTSEPIGRLRGRVHHYQGVPTIVTYHPAYLLRNPADKARAWDDLCLAREVMGRA
ncbi:uracil-DNA glycosylase [Methylibium sp.]|uniref:uracil-DNA glycosylase n=1 Tax=Methylibium sp. TaxID=2067992 RepID=UPI003D15118C